MNKVLYLFKYFQLEIFSFIRNSYKFLENVSGYACNHGSLRIGNETLRPLEQWF